MTVRLTVLVGCLIALVSASPSLFAETEQSLACCTLGGDDCGLLVCCDWTLVADEPCSDENTGFCKATCVRNTNVR